MKIALTATGPSLDAEVDPRFGRCRYFIIADTETKEFEALDNSSSTASGGAGISAAQMIAGKGVEAILTGNCGPNAHQVLSSAGIKIVSGVSGKISDAIEEYKLGTFAASPQPNVADHFGMSYEGGGSGTGTGRGMGRGGGMGRGVGRGMGMGDGTTPPSDPASQPSGPGQEIDALKDRPQALAQQLDEIQQRIEDLRKKQE